MANESWDFSGYATRNNLLCGDGRTIRQDAFKSCDGIEVPLLWNHERTQDAVLGKARLENRADGVYAYGTFNDTDRGQDAKRLMQHGDIRCLSIFANHLTQRGGDVIGGKIRELSLVHAGANPGAYVDFVVAHGDDDEDTGMYACYDESAIVIHSDSASDNEKEDESMEEEKKNNEETIQDILDSMTPKQREATEILVGMALAENNTDDEEDDDDMKHNAFDTDTQQGGYLTHSDEQAILNLAKSNQCGSFQAALQQYCEDNTLQHDDVSGFDQTQMTTGVLFPDYHDVRPGAPELISDDQGWVSKVMSKVTKSPFSRIRTSQVDIRGIEELRAKGYQKGNRKTPVGNYNLVRRTTDPQTVYVKSAMHRDDIIDVTDFSIVDYQYQIDKQNLNQELATAILFGDGREPGDEGKIEADKIRPIWHDDELYTKHVTIDVDAAAEELQGGNTTAMFGNNFIHSEAMVNACLYAREDFKGTGTPDMFIAPHKLNVMLLARDISGHRLYASKTELAQALNVGEIIPCEKMEGMTRENAKGEKVGLVALIVNLKDYSLGAAKGGEVTHFSQFDIDFNQQKSLLETRVSGANTRIYSAIAIEEPKA